jgi:hypothetical protein
LIRLSTSSSTHFQPHLNSLPRPLLGGPSPPTLIHHHQFGNNIMQGQAPPLLPMPINNDEHQKQSPFPRRASRFEDREGLTQSHDNNGHQSDFHRGRASYNDRTNSSAISRGTNRGRGG